MTSPGGRPAVGNCHNGNKRARAGIKDKGDGAGLHRADVCQQTPPTLMEAAPYLHPAVGRVAPAVGLI